LRLQKRKEREPESVMTAGKKKGLGTWEGKGIEQPSLSTPHFMGKG